MRIFVTGATGFIGRHLCQRLAARGDQVVALVRSRAKAGLLPAGVEIVEGDLSIFANPATVLPPVDVVIHLAGVVAADRPEQYEAINHDAVRDLVACLGRQSWKPARLLFASSLAAGGPSTPDRPLTEGDPPRPIDPYGDAKARAEAIVRAAPFPTTAFRPALVFGPGDEASLTLFRAARTGVGIRVAGPPQALSFVDVRDLAEAIVRMADDRRPGAHCYYACHPARLDVHALWRALARAVGRRVWVMPIPRAILYLAMRAATAASALFGIRNQLDRKQYVQMIAPAFVCSSQRLSAELDWTAQHDLDDCLTHAAQGYRSTGALRS